MCDHKNLFKDNNSYQVYSNIENIIADNISNICYVRPKFIKYFKNIRNFVHNNKDSLLESYSEKIQPGIKDINRALLENDTIIFHSRKMINDFYKIDYRDVFYNNLSPVDHIQSLIYSYIHNNSNFNNVLGVQVRRGDLFNNPRSMNRLIPIDKYFEKIDDHLRSNKYDKIFIATESIDVISEFHNRYNNMVIAYPIDEYNRSEKGVIYALIDLILLSKCSLIIAGESGIPDAAARIGNVEYIRLAL